MRYLVHMVVRLPETMDPATAAELRAKEKARALEIQRSGVWPHLWRVVGQVANYSVFDVSSHEELHGLLTSLPLFPYMEVEVVPLATHPSALEAQPDG
ncbi:MAG TPA: muconolactone Delta-isomerase [Acidimicrobiales bacterium]|jgi:muconolactone D-isomerase|nr:muconolactone Delta-isomerase [Acidimicrobiales bacterium]